MKKFWNFSKKDRVGELYLYGEISSSTWWGDEVTPKQFKDDLDALGDIDALHVYVNSPGGDVFAGWAIINIMRRHKATKIGYNDGLAASIAFDILMAMDRVIAAKNSMFMTHNCWTFALGNRHELRKQADEMEKIDGMLAEEASKRSGKTVDEMMQLQDAETWYTASEAKDEGFADELAEEKKVAACITPVFIARYKHPPENLRAEAPPEGGFFMPEQQGKEPVSDMDTQKRRFANSNRKFIIAEVKR